MSGRLAWRRPIRWGIAGLALIVLLRVAGGLLLDSVVSWQVSRSPAGWPLAAGLVLGSPVLFGSSALPSLERILEQRPRLAVEAWAAIARLRPGRAARLLDELAPASPGERAWFEPPRPSPELLALLRRRLEPGASDALDEESRRRWQWQLEHSCIIGREDGSALVIFSHPYLGGATDLWLHREDRPESAYIGSWLGSEHHPDDFELRCSLPEADSLELVWSYADEPYRGAPVPPPPALVSLPELAADSDGDGLTDRVERRLLTDPLARDSDGDGVEDLVDRSPNGGRSPAPESLDAAIDELLRTLFAFWDPACERRTVLFLVSDRRPERWARSCGPTINLPASGVESLPGGVDVLSVEPYNDRWGRFGSMSTPPGGPGDLIAAVVRPGATRLLVVNDHVASDSEGYEVRMRRHDGRWQLVWLENLWL